MLPSSETVPSQPDGGSLVTIEFAAARLPLYCSLPENRPPFVHTADDLRAVAENQIDPFGGRHDPDHPPVAFVQVARDLSLYWAFARADLRALAAVTVRAWLRLGVSPGQRVAFYDYATSPAVMFTSRSYVANMEAGAADILGCMPICNDGLPELADRCVHILEYFHPETLFVDVELMDPLIRAMASRSIPILPPLVVVTGDESLADEGSLQEWGAALGTAVKQMMRVDAALLVAAPCPVEHMTFHPDEAGYRMEAIDLDRRSTSSIGRLAVTNLAVRSSVVVRYLTELYGGVRTGLCACGHSGAIVEIRNAP